MPGEDEGMKKVRLMVQIHHEPKRSTRECQAFVWLRWWKKTPCQYWYKSTAMFNWVTHAGCTLFPCTSCSTNSRPLQIDLLPQLFQPLEVCESINLYVLQRKTFNDPRKQPIAMGQPPLQNSLKAPGYGNLYPVLFLFQVIMFLDYAGLTISPSTGTAETV